MLRYPDGKREQISLPEQAKLLVSGSDGMGAALLLSSSCN